MSTLLKQRVFRFDGKQTTLSLLEYGGLYRVKEVTVLDDPGSSRLLQHEDLTYDSMSDATAEYSCRESECEAAEKAETTANDPGAQYARQTGTHHPDCQCNTCSEDEFPWLRSGAEY